MKQVFFKLNNIPDLSLGKYQSLSNVGVDGILEQHTSFLRQWHRVALLGNLSLHLYISYSPNREKSKKIEIGFLINANEENNEYLEKAKKVLMASPLSEYYELNSKRKIKENGETKYLENEIEYIDYKYLSTLYKKERFLQPLQRENSPSFFYVVPKWEMDEKARLYNMLKLMQSLDEECLYRVDIYPKEISENIKNAFSKPLSWLRSNTGFQTDEFNLTGERKNAPKDPNAEETLKQYEEYLKDIDTSPVFYVNINVFANNSDTSNILLDAAATESIKSGYYSIRTNEGEYNTKSFLDKAFESLSSDKAPESLKMWPTTYTLDDLTPFFRFPALYDGEVIEIPKETAPKYNENGMLIGKDLNGYDVNLDIKSFAKHMFVCGVPGSGKTNTMLHLTSTLWQKYKIPFLVLEPAKQEYRVLSKFDMPELIVFSPSANTRLQLRINPFEFPMGLTLSEHISKLCAVFEGAFPLQPPTPFLLDRAIENIYLKKGWKTNEVNDGTKQYPRMSELYAQLQEEINKTNYDGEVRGNIQSALEMRIGSLLRREMKDIFDVQNSIIRPEDWLKMPIVIELESLGEGPANFTTLMLCTLIRETLKANPNADSEKPLRHVIFIEEAHNLIGPDATPKTGDEANPKVAATAFIVKMLAEVRALREGIVIADQLPTAMAPEVIKNTNIKLVHRLTSSDDRELIGNTMSATPMQIEAMATLTQGGAFMNYEGLLRPFQMQVHYTKEHDVPAPSNLELYDIMENRPAYIELKKKASEKELGNIEKEVDEFIDELENFYQTKLKDYVYEKNKMDVKIKIFRSKLNEYLDKALEIDNEITASKLYNNDCLEIIERLEKKGIEITLRIERYIEINKVKIAQAIEKIKKGEM